MFAAIGLFFKGLSPRVWLFIALALALAGAVFMHQRAAHRAIKNADAAGYARASNEIAAKAQALEAKANRLNAAIAAQARKRNDEENRLIARSADDLRVRGSGKANCPRNPGLPAGAGQSRPTSGGADAAGPAMPSDDLAAVPWDWLVDRAEQADLNRAEALAWRDWYRRMVEAWPKG